MFKINKMNFKIIKNNSGFSLVEMLVTMAIISTGMIGIFSLIIQNIQVQKVNKDFLVASMLAQEGLELVRSIRDETWLDSTLPPPGTWDKLVGVYTNDDFVIDPISGPWITEAANAILPTITDDPVCRLYLDGNDFYTHLVPGNTPTQFYRFITVTNGPDSDLDGTWDYITVISQVEWVIKDSVKKYIAETLLYDWR